MPGQRATGVRIFIEPSGVRWLNLGDALMLETALRRVRALWPAASITVHSFDSGEIARADAGASVLDPSGSWGWSADAIRLGSSTLLDPLRRHAPAVMRLLARGVVRWRRQDPDSVDRYLDAVRSADLVLLTGAGLFNDEFKARAFLAIESLELAMNAGVPTALMGQGLGPLQHAPLRRRAAQVLRRAKLIALRERLAGVPLLASFGVSPERIVVTGDDAIEPAYEARPAVLGAAIGFNLRRSHYAGLSAEAIAAAGAAVRRALRAHAVPLVPIAISRYAYENDLAVVREATGEREAGDDPVTTAGLLRATRECRVVVAASYHAAVVALAMGIPVIAIAASPYYIDKFRGLADQFGAACRIELASGAGFPDRLAAAIDVAWETADATRPRLLEAAVRQIEAGRGAYRRLAEVIAT